MLGPSTELLVSNTNHNLMLTINGIDILTLCFSSGVERGWWRECSDYIDEEIPSYGST